MSVNIEDHLKINYLKALEKARWVCARTCNVIFAGAPVADNFVGLSHGKKKKLGFNGQQIKQIESKDPFLKMDLTLLCAILYAFGNLPPAGNLKLLLINLKGLRNEFGHEEHNLNFNKRTVKDKIKEVRDLCCDILEELKIQYPASIALLDQDICDVKKELIELEKTLDDHIGKKTKALCEAVSKLTKDVDKNTSKLTKVVEDSKLSLTDVVGKSKQRLEESTTKVKEDMEKSTSVLTAIVNDLDIKYKELNANPNKQDRDQKFLNFVKGEMIDYLKNICQIQTAEGLDHGTKTTPQKIMTNFCMLKIRELHKNDNVDSEQIEYQLILEIKDPKTGEPYEVLLITSDGGMGKTTFLKFIAEVYGVDNDKIKGLNDFDLVMYIECRNRGINSFDDLLMLHCPNSAKEFEMTLDEMKNFIKSKKVLYLIDGYDEAHSGTKKVVSEILHMRSAKVFVSTRPCSLSNISRLVPQHKNVTTLEILGILPEHHNDFVWRLICTLVGDEEERRRIWNELISELRKLRIMFGTMLNSPMILNHLTHLIVEDSTKFKTITTRSKLFDALRSLKICKVLRRLEFKLDDAEDLDEVVKLFIEIYEVTGFKTYTNDEFELSLDTTKEVIDDCKEKKLPYKELLSTFYDTIQHHEGLLVKTGYKYLHLTEQEHAVGRFLAKCITEELMKNMHQKVAKSHPYINILNTNIIWEYMTGNITESTLMDRKDEVPRFRNILIFLTGELARLSSKSKKLKNIFEKLAVRLVHIGWLCTYEQIFLDTQYEKDVYEKEITCDLKDAYKQSTPFEKEEQIETREKDPSEISLSNSHHDSIDSLHHLEFHETEDTETNNSSENSDVTEAIDTVNSSEFISEEHNVGKEDFALSLLSESEMEENMNIAVSSKLGTKDEWIITNVTSFPALNVVLKTKQPKQISISIDSDPLSYPDLNETIKILTEKKIELELFISGHYTGKTPGLSDAWINKDCKIIDFLGNLGEEGFRNLPTALTSMNTAVDVPCLACLCQKLPSLRNLQKLGLQIDIGSIENPGKLPKLPYTGTFASLTLVSLVPDGSLPQSAAISDKCIPVAVATIAQLCPMKRDGEWTSICLKNTSITSMGMHELLKALHRSKLRISDSLRIWSSQDISVKQKTQLRKMAEEFYLGTLFIYDVLSTTTALPKQIMKQTTSLDAIDVVKAEALRKKQTELMKNYSCKELNGLELRVLEMQQSYPENRNIKRFQLGNNNDLPNRKLIIVGQTGAGKTTLVNVFINNILGVKFDDCFRYSVYDINKRIRSESESQTDAVTEYIINYKEGVKRKCNFVFVDTPGLGDTRGLEVQKENTQQILNYISKQPSIVALVIHSSSNTLTAELKNILLDIKSIIRTDKFLSLIILSTVATSNSSSVKKLLDSFSIPYSYVYLFNNNALYCKKEGIEENDLNSFKNNWIASNKSIDKVLDLLSTDEDLMSTSQPFLKKIQQKAETLKKTDEALKNTDEALKKKQKEMVEFFATTEGDNVGRMIWSGGGTTVSFSMTGTESFFKGALGMVGRLATLNTLNRIRSIDIYNVNPATREDLEKEYKDNGDSMNMKLIKKVLQANNKTLEKTERNYEAFLAAVDYKLWLD